jgi:hypothetical protein
MSSVSSQYVKPYNNGLSKATISNKNQLNKKLFEIESAIQASKEKIKEKSTNIKQLKNNFLYQKMNVELPYFLLGLIATCGAIALSVFAPVCPLTLIPAGVLLGAGGKCEYISYHASQEGNKELKKLRENSKDQKKERESLLKSRKEKKQIENSLYELEVKPEKEILDKVYKLSPGMKKFFE